ncbi:MAG: hypothetical protein QOG21_1234 [Actinomycetota bacterium]|jgi:hypothetical protein|nr:hypothetical protein [Actinomycetota bacterium]
MVTLFADGILDSIPPGPGLLGVAALLAILGAYLFVRRRGAPILRVALLVLSLTVLTGYLSAGSPKPPPRVTLRVLSPADGEVVPAGKSIPVLLQLKGAVLIPPTTQSFSTPPPSNAGHIHILVDGRLVQSTGQAQVTLSPGRHSVAAEFVDPYHRSFSPRIIDSVTVVARR